MPTVTTTAGDTLFYRDDSFSAPWESPSATLLLHAEAESGIAWYGWMQRLAGRSRVIRPDMRGAGRSVGMRPGQAWSLDRLAADVVSLMDGIGLDRAHVVAARFAGPVALRLASSRPDRVMTLALCSVTPCPEEVYAERAERWIDQIEHRGMDAWAVNAVQDRLAGQTDEEILQGWAGLLAAADADTLVGLFSSLAALDATADLARIDCPTLVATTDASAALPLDAVTAWQRAIKGAELLVLTGQGDHVAATNARDLAGAVQDFHRKAARQEGAGRRKGGDGPAGARAERDRRREERSAQRARGRA
jgi:pimeloyl-ACP methyl ester carboxylesterase